MMTSTWDTFDRCAEQLVRREITFDRFARSCRGDFERLARSAAGRRRLPAWFGVDDVASLLVQLAWHYALERVSRTRDGRAVKGYEPGLYAAGAGAYLRWKLRRRIAKEISRARGENQHRRGGPGAPEFLSKTGEHGGVGGLPEIEVAPASESRVDRALRFKHLRRMAETPREVAVIGALEAADGDEEIVFTLAAQNAGVSRDVAKKHVGQVVREWATQLGAAAAA